jgi:hypothetical protein
MIFGSPPLFQLYRLDPMLSPDGRMSFTPVAGAPSIELCEEAARQLKLTKYSIVAVICVKSTVDPNAAEPIRAIVPANK